MEIFKRIKQLVKEVDLFAQVPAYRYNEDTNFKTVTGGFISLITMLFFIGVFANTFINTLNKKDVNFTISRFAQESPAYYATTLENTFLFAIGLTNIDLNKGERYFDISLDSKNYTLGNKQQQNIELSQCKRSSWQARGYGDKYDRLGLNKWLCPPEDLNLQMQGKYTSEIFRFYKITVSKCKASTNPTRACATSQQLDTFLNTNDVFSLNYYYINTIINAGDSEKEYLQEYLEDVNYFAFTPSSGMTANLFISSYTIETDQSLWPLTSVREDTGGIVLDPAQTSIYQVRTGSEYMKLYLRKSPITVAITRSFKKIDETLSYIGGLFSFLLIFLFFVNKYNEYAFDIELTRHSYYCEKNEPFDANFFNFLRFFPFVVYRILDMFNFNPDWPAYAKMNEFLQAGRKHLDIRLITKKILLVEKLGLAVLGRNQFEALMLSEPYTLEDAEKIRQSMKFYKRFIKKFPKNSDVENDPVIVTASNILSGKIIPSGKSLGIAEFLGSSGTIIPTNNMIKQDQNLQHPRPFEQLGHYKSRQIRHKQLFHHQISMIKRTLDELQKNMARGDKIAVRIWNELDDKIKNTYNLLTRYEALVARSTREVESL